MKKISIIVPVYYNQDNLLPLYADLKEKVLTKLPEGIQYELIMVDDGSKDNSYKVMQELAKIDSNIKTIRLSRNFGEHAAILAGLSQCTGDSAVRKAADLQEPSEMILDMMKKYDVVALGELLIDFTENGKSNQGNPFFEANPGGAWLVEFAHSHNLHKIISTHLLTWLIAGVIVGFRWSVIASLEQTTAAGRFQ